MSPRVPACFVTAAIAMALLGCSGAEPFAPTKPVGLYTGNQLAAPTSVAVVALSSDRVRVTWQDNTNNETRFEVFRSWSSAVASTNQLQVAAANATMLEVGGLSASAEYCFQVRAVRDKGGAIAISQFSTAVCARTMALPEPAPTAARITSVMPIGNGTVWVRWVSQVVLGLRSRLDRSLDGGATWEAVTTLGGMQEGWYYDGGLPDERAFCYRVVDYNTTATAPPSNTACTALPAAPTELTATAIDAATIELTWRDNSAVEDGYEVRAVIESCYGDDSGELYCDLYEYIVATLPANTTSYRGAPQAEQSWTVYPKKDGGYGTAASVGAPPPTP